MKTRMETPDTMRTLSCSATRWFSSRIGCCLLVGGFLGWACAAPGEVATGSEAPDQHVESGEDANGHDDHPDGADENHSEGVHVELAPEAVRAAGIVVEPVAVRPMAPNVEVTGRLGYDERRMAVATARIGGRITRVVADYGAPVSSGDVLAWIDSPELGAAQAEYRRAKSAARVREAELERARILLEGQAISRGELLRREGEWEATRAELESAVQTLHLLGLSGSDVEALDRQGASPSTVYPVRSTLAGRVTERSASVGQVVAPDTRLFVVAELDDLWLMVQLFEKDLPAVSEGSSVTLQCESHPQDRFEGEIDFVADVVDPHSRTITARAVIDNAEGKLKPGMFVYAQIASSGAAATEVLAVPLHAVVELDGLGGFDGGDAVFVAAGEGSFAAREVALGRRWSEWVEVRSGLEAGERVVVRGAFVLRSEALAGSLEGHHH